MAACFRYDEGSHHRIQRAARWGPDATREIALLTIAVADPDPDDALIARLGDPAWLAWMRANFRESGAVAELGGADSYARRLRDYAGTGRDQVAWLAARLAADPGARDATITTFQPEPCQGQLNICW